MTRKKLCEKIEALFECYEELTPFTKALVNDHIDPYCEEFYLSERQCLKNLVVTIKNSLGIMRQDIVDYDLLTKTSYYIERRLKTIEDERE